MANNGPVAVQGLAYRVSSLNADGSVVGYPSSACAIIQDNVGFVKLECKPVMLDGKDITPESAAGVPIVSWKDYNRYKRWEVTLSLGTDDPEAMQLAAGGVTLSMPGSSGRTFTDGATTLNEALLTSPALADFLPGDVGRTVSGTNIAMGAYIMEYISSTVVRMNIVATGTGTNESLTLGALPSVTTGYQFPKLLDIPQQNGVSIEVWSRLITRGTESPGTTPYPTMGTPSTPPSAYLRTGVFRCYLYHEAFSIENKEQMPVMSGWAIENAEFGTGPADDWRIGAVTGVGTPYDTTAFCDMMSDFALPSPLEAGLQSPNYPA